MLGPMTARKTRPRPKPVRRRNRSTGASGARRFHAQRSLTRSEIAPLEAAAAADLRSVGNFVSKLTVEELLRSARRRRTNPPAKPGDQRVAYGVRIWLTAAQKKKLDAQARAQMRSMGTYVTKLVLEYLRGC